MSDYLIRGAISNAVNFPSITAEEAPKLKPFIALAEGLGSFAGQLTTAPIEKVTIVYEGAVADLKIKALTSAAIAGLLRPSLQDINVVSAPAVAAQRGIVVEEVTRAAQGDYESFITLTRDDEGPDPLDRRNRVPRRQAAHPVDQGHQGRRGIHAVDDLCHQRGQAGLHRPVRERPRRRGRQYRDLRAWAATNRAVRRSRWCRSTATRRPRCSRRSASSRACGRRPPCTSEGAGGCRVSAPAAALVSWRSIDGQTRTKRPAVPARASERPDPRLLELLVCPLTRDTLIYDPARQELISRAAKLAYPIRDGVPIMLPDEARKLDD